MTSQVTTHPGNLTDNNNFNRCSHVLKVSIYFNTTHYIKLNKNVLAKIYKWGKQACKILNILMLASSLSSLLPRKFQINLLSQNVKYTIAQDVLLSGKLHRFSVICSYCGVKFMSSYWTNKIRQSYSLHLTILIQSKQYLSIDLNNKVRLDSYCSEIMPFSCINPCSWYHHTILESLWHSLLSNHKREQMFWYFSHWFEKHTGLELFLIVYKCQETVSVLNK